jgi:hypothetical protein
LGIGGDVIRQKFQGHKAAKIRVLSLIDDAHAAATEFFQNPIVGYRSPGHGV